MVGEVKVREGYKKTEVGIIPEDWMLTKLAQLTTEIGDGIHTTPSYVAKSEFYFINGNNLSNGEVVLFDETKCVSYGEYMKHMKKLNNRTTLMSINGTIGNLAYYNDERIILGKSVCYININKVTKKEFVYFQLKSKYVSAFYKDELTGSTIKNLSLKSIRNTPIIIPCNEEEQKAIATALTDIDNLIQSLKKLIEKKKKIKQGTMQQLLTGKKRLPGFSGELIKLQLKDILELNKGSQLNRNTLSEKGDYPVINGGIEPSGYTSVWNCSEETITISEGGNSCGYVNFLRTKFWSGGHLYTVKLKYDTIYKQYLYYLLKFNEPKIMSLRVGSGLPNIQKKSIGEFQLNFMADYEEQQAIAQVLSDMDSEIEVLEQKLEKLKTIKQGMMQELLTGRIRLI